METKARETDFVKVRPANSQSPWAIMSRAEAEQMINDSDDKYDVVTTTLTDDEVSKLPEFEGW